MSRSCMAKPVNAASLLGPATSTLSKVTIADGPLELFKRKAAKTEIEQLSSSPIVDAKALAKVTRWPT
jgi:hypothetical protein